MYQETATARIESTPNSTRFVAAEVITTKLTAEHQSEVLAFLARRLPHTVMLMGFIRDNGLVSSLNRGTFYGCRNRNGELEGVALIGHATLIESKTDRALQAFAELALQCTSTHLVMGEEERVKEFWFYYGERGQEIRSDCREHLLELSWPVQVRDEVPGLRLATFEDLDLVIPVHAQMAFEEGGVNPLELDPQGFRARCARRIEQARSWVLVENGQLIFKAEVIAETREAVYLEGVWVSPVNRGAGYGSRCMSQLSRELLGRSKSLVLFVNDKNNKALSFYEQAGFKRRAYYKTLFLM